MNKKIKELADEAGFIIKPFYTGEDNFQTPHYKDERIEKFADLIVKECINVCENYSIPFPIEIWQTSSKKEISKITALEIAEKIKRNFGEEI